MKEIKIKLFFKANGFGLGFNIERNTGVIMLNYSKDDSKPDLKPAKYTSYPLRITLLNWIFIMSFITKQPLNSIEEALNIQNKEK